MSAPGRALPLLLALVFAGAAPAADWSLAPRMTLNGEYNTNPYLDYGQSHERTGGTFDLLLPFTAKTELTDFSLNLGGNVRRYANDPLGNEDDERVSMAIDQTRERSGWKASAGWTRDTTLTSELGTTGLTQANQRHYRYDASIAPQIQLSPVSLFAFGVSGEMNRYQDAELNGLSDYDYASVYASYARQLSEVTTVGVGATVSGYSVPNQSSSESANANAHLTVTHQYTERLGLDAYVGPSYARTRDRALDTWGADGMLALKYSGLRTDFSVSAEHRYAPAGLGNLTTRDSAALGMTWRLAEKLASQTTLRYERSTDALYASGATPYRTYYWTATETLHWQFAETLAAALSVEGTRQDTNTQPEHAERFLAYLGFVWSPRPLF